jgi:ferredoxin
MRFKSLFLTSTIKFWREGRGTPGYGLLDWLHGYVYGRWPYLYIGVGTGEHKLSKILAQLWKLINPLIHYLHTKADAGEGESSDSPNGRISFADTYHGKVVPLDAARQLVTVNEDITLPNLEKVIPYARAKDIILKNPDHIAALDCPCRASRSNPCLPLDVCLIVGEPFVSFVTEHQPERSRHITPMEAVQILNAEDERGHVHHAFFKDAMLGRFYAICNCCSCCCGAMQAHQNGTPMLASSGYVCQVDYATCIACGVCTDYCQFHALSLSNEACTVDADACMGCGVCVSKCEQGALSLMRDPQRGEPLEILNLLTEENCLAELFSEIDEELTPAK